MPALFTALWSFLQRAGAWLTASIAANGLSWIVGAAVSAAYVLLWVGVWDSFYSYLNDRLAVASSVDVLGSVPSGILWLLNQTFPLRLMFDLSLSLLMFRFTSAYAVLAAVSATRQFKGK